MIRLPESLKAWETPGFEAVFRQEVAALGPDRLPLHRGLAKGNHVLDHDIGCLMLAAEATPETIRVKAGFQYWSLLLGCACENDPTPVDEMPEYCEVLVEIDRRTGGAAVTLLPD